MKIKRYLLTNPSTFSDIENSDRRLLFAPQDWATHHEIINNESIQVLSGLGSSYAISRKEEIYLENLYHELLIDINAVYKKYGCDNINTERLVGAWLRSVVYYSYQVWRYVDRISQQSLVPVIVDNGANFQLRNTRDFFESLSTGVFNNVALSIALEMKNVDSLWIKAPNGITGLERQEGATDTLSKSARNAIKGVLIGVLNGIVNGLFFWKKELTVIHAVKSPLVFFLLGNLLTNNKWLISKGMTFQHGRTNLIPRKALNSRIASRPEHASFPEYVRALIEKTAPKNYLNISGMYTFTGIPSSRLGKVITSTAHWQDDDFKRFVSIDMPHTKLVIYQHGGTYGTMIPPIHQEKLELDISSRYLTWGWNCSYRLNVIPFAANIFSRRRWLIKPKRIRHVRIILTRFKPFSRGDLWDSNPWNKLYLSNIVDIAKTLSERYGMGIVIRQHPAQFRIFDLEPYLTHQIPNVTFDKKPLLEVPDDSVDIITQNSTVLITKMIRGAPFLYFNPFGFCNLNETAYTHFKSLCSAKIFHVSSAGMIQHIASLANHSMLIKWWNSEDVRSSVKNFLMVFGDRNYRQVYEAFKHL